METAVLTDEQTLHDVLETLIEHVSIDMHGACTEETLFTILLRAASTNETIEHTCDTLEDAPVGRTICYHLEKCQDMLMMEQVINDLLHARMPGHVTRRPQRLAMDLNLQPYYGTPNPQELPYIYRSKAEAGTCSFYAYATADVICHGKRVTVALIPIRHDDTMVSIITRLLDRLAPLELRIKRLYLDRGFFSVPVIRWLHALDIPFEMPVIIRGKQGGTRQLIQKGKGYKTRYTMTSPVYGTVTFDVAVVCVYSNGRYGKHGREYFVYATYRVPLGLRSLYHDYRRRFGIESSYRLKNTCRIRTTMKNPVVRLLCVGIAFLLIDVWVSLLWDRVSRPRQGGRQIIRARFPLKRLLEFVRQAIDQHYHIKRTIFL